MRAGSWVGYGLIGALSLAAAGLLSLKVQSDTELAMGYFRNLNSERAKNVASAFSEVTRQIFLNVRTIGQLPGVKSMKRHGEGFEINALRTIQQIYGNLASEVDVSEVYVVPETLNPDRIDPETGKPEAPMMMFDSAIDTSQGATPEKPAHEEVESYEYAEFVRQFKWLKEHAASRDPASTAAYPLLVSPQLITCDNSEYDRTLKDKDREGIIFSVPFYTAAGDLKGVVAAIIRTNALKRLLPEKNFAIVNLGNGSMIRQTDDPLVSGSEAYALKGTGDPALIYSGAIDLQIGDALGTWKLWSGVPNEAFYESRDYQAIREFSLVGYGLCAGFALLVSLVWWLYRKNKGAISAMQAALNRELAERTEEVHALVREQERLHEAGRAERHAVRVQLARSFEDTVVRMFDLIVELTGRLDTHSAEVLSCSSQTRIKSEETLAEVESISRFSESAAANGQQVSQSMETMKANYLAVSDVVRSASDKADVARSSILSLSENSSKVNEVVSVIDSIAGQINLLALNATIESARAGEAGKGFAVVASEVKALATQVQKATEQISVQISAIQSSTGQSVATVMQTFETIEQLSEAMVRSQELMAEQAALADNIARELEEGLVSARTVAGTTKTMAGDAHRTTSLAGQVRQSTTELGQRVGEVRRHVSAFLAEMVA